MTAPELLTLMDREADMLAGENNHCAATIMRAAAEQIRAMMQVPDQHLIPPPPPPRK